MNLCVSRSMVVLLVFLNCLDVGLWVSNGISSLADMHHAANPDVLFDEASASSSFETLDVSIRYSIKREQSAFSQRTSPFYDKTCSQGLKTPYALSDISTALSGWGVVRRARGV